MAKDVQFHLLLLITLFLGISSSLYLSQNSVTINAGETFVVICKDDEGGQTVTWRGPRSVLGSKTHPQVRPSSYGLSIVFEKTKIEDSGNYTCTLSNNPKVKAVFSLKVEEYITLPPSTEEYDDIIDNYIPIDITTTERTTETVTYKSSETVEVTTEGLKFTSTTGVNNRKNGNNKRVHNNSGENNGRNREPKTSLPTKPKSPKGILRFIDTPDIQKAKEGEDFVIQCHVNLKNIKMMWSFPNKAELPDRYKSDARGLHIPSVTREDAQEYQCQAVQSHVAQIKSKNITLVVLHKPILPYSVYAEEEEVYAFLGEQVNLTCEVEANPAPNFIWPRRKMGHVITVSSHISVLELNMTEDTPGTYHCTAYNDLGTLEKYFDVQLGERPDSPTNIELKEATGSSLEIEVEVPYIPNEVRNSVMDPQWIVVEYKPLSGNEWYAEETSILSDFILLTNLTKNTKYEIKAATRNIAGLSEYFSNNTIFETSLATRVHTPFLVYLTIIVLTPLIWMA